MTQITININPSPPAWVDAVKVPVGTFFRGKVGSEHYRSILLLRVERGLVNLEDPSLVWDFKGRMIPFEIFDYRPLKQVEIRGVE